MENKKRLISLLKSNMAVLQAAGTSATATLRLADNLIENGVTVNEWIPVTERLPDITKQQKEHIELDYLLAPEFNVLIKGAKKATTLYYDGDGNWFDMGGTCYPVAYWMPLPEPPMEVE